MALVLHSFSHVLQSLSPFLLEPSRKYLLGLVPQHIVKQLDKSLLLLHFLPLLLLVRELVFFVVLPIVAIILQFLEHVFDVFPAHLQIALVVDHRHIFILFNSLHHAQVVIPGRYDGLNYPPSNFLDLFLLFALILPTHCEIDAGFEQEANEVGRIAFDIFFCPDGLKAIEQILLWSS